LESQGKKPTQNHENPKQHTPFCLGYRTGVLESGLSADVELRERKGGWLVRNWSLVVVSRVLAMALHDDNNHVMELVGNESFEKGDGFQQNSLNLRHIFGCRKTKRQPRSAQSSQWLKATCRV
jgi:hypothetical protein